jgi:hypothetical protein
VLYDLNTALQPLLCSWYDIILAECSRMRSIIIHSCSIARLPIPHTCSFSEYRACGTGSSLPHGAGNAVGRCAGRPSLPRCRPGYCAGVSRISFSAAGMVTGSLPLGRRTSSPKGSATEQQQNAECYDNVTHDPPLVM